jgi:hypothetical protein
MEQIVIILFLTGIKGWLSYYNKRSSNHAVERAGSVPAFVLTLNGFEQNVAISSPG